jgi:hypothetical protein
VASAGDDAQVRRNDADEEIKRNVDRRSPARVSHHDEVGLERHDRAADERDSSSFGGLPPRPPRRER